MPELFFYLGIPAMIAVYILVVDEIYGGHINKILLRNSLLNSLLNSKALGGFLGIVFWGLSIMTPLMLLFLLFDLEALFHGISFWTSTALRLVIALALYIYLFAVYDHFRLKKDV